MKRMTDERPFYMLGPLVTDIGPGHDHIVAAIGASLSSAYGADFICYVTPAEHLALPNIEDVRQGVITARIAAHIGDMVKNGARDKDLEMGRARRDRTGRSSLIWPLIPRRLGRSGARGRPQIAGFAPCAEITVL